MTVVAIAVVACVPCYHNDTDDDQPCIEYNPCAERTSPALMLGAHVNGKVCCRRVFHGIVSTFGGPAQRYNHCTFCAYFLLLCSHQPAGTPRWPCQCSAEAPAAVPLLALVLVAALELYNCHDQHRVSASAGTTITQIHACTCAYACACTSIRPKTLIITRDRSAGTYQWPRRPSLDLVLDLTYACPRKTRDRDRCRT